MSSKQWYSFDNSMKVIWSMSTLTEVLALYVYYVYYVHFPVYSKLSTLFAIMDAVNKPNIICVKIDSWKDYLQGLRNYT